MDKSTEIKNFVDSLKNPTLLKTNKSYNNPWENNVNYKNLLNFLIKQQNAKYILIGEAPGRKGCLQCGVPFCDDYTIEKCIEIPDKKAKKSKETSAQRIYQAFKNDFIAWNAFPYQPCKENGSNRPPTLNEIKYGNLCLIEFLKIFYNKNKKIILLGNKAEYACRFLNLKYKKVLHPSCSADIRRESLGYGRGITGWLTYINDQLKD